MTTPPTQPAAAATAATGAATATAANPHAHDSHHDSHDAEMIWFWAAGCESVIYSVFIFVMYQGWLVPSISGSTAVALVTARIIGITALFGIAHIYLQKKLETCRPAHEASRTLKLVDVITSFLPALALVLAMFVASKTVGQFTAWWIEVRIWIVAIVAASVCEDIAPTVRVMIGGRRHQGGH